MQMVDQRLEHDTACGKLAHRKRDEEQCAAKIANERPFARKSTSLLRPDDVTNASNSCIRTSGVLPGSAAPPQRTTPRLALTKSTGRKNKGKQIAKCNKLRSTRPRRTAQKDAKHWHMAVAQTKILRTYSQSSCATLTTCCQKC